MFVWRAKSVSNFVVAVEREPWSRADTSHQYHGLAVAFGVRVTDGTGYTAGTQARQGTAVFAALVFDQAGGVAGVGERQRRGQTGRKQPLAFLTQLDQLPSDARQYAIAARED
ncbi:hypothetical protein NITHO_530009 [Nitrolancea hollandica Lb]|uniref:Uncharacterized protein n=1 Tax=Nitrolancea hollandica Lb TaxID=1129897 RepID=I4ELT9_9BACT|nr:hypothetical protein NITHO_530009 [Nitrolancea hollandica Lb]